LWRSRGSGAWEVFTSFAAFSLVTPRGRPPGSDRRVSLSMVVSRLPGGRRPSLG